MQQINRNMSKLVAVRMTDAQHEQIESNARAIGMPLSTYLRVSALRQPLEVKTQTREELTHAK